MSTVSLNDTLDGRLEVLLDKLATDDAFRDLFQLDPRVALHAIGVRHDLDAHAKQAEDCLSAGNLPAKATIAAARQRLSAQIDASRAPYVIFRV